MSATTERATVLLMEAAHAETEEETGVFDLRLGAGEFALVLAPDPARAALFADLAGGTVAAASGRVLFLGQDWARVPHDVADALRGRIGRVFHEGGWVPHLSMATNVLLPLLHHTRAPEGEARDRAADLARAFGLPGLPLGWPHASPSGDRARAACVRAFLGEPSLLILESPLMEGRVPDLMARLRDAIAAARSRGAACLWLTASALVWDDPGLPATERLRLTDFGLRAERPAR
ncbi:organic solvent ABC transporter ATP-binding protein [Roseomonas hellenica]|uniref:Organic solvent ABC transporter ATP-binding protein n=1 Tax=Plastoroseomonas hellenica TaxID=2687306 RepID=A0ABS5F7E4_9PROT|nr:ATP-binding cassette domain-containing protein [Plastoroseomonas hellenica]MBR0668363.1 organic solvent ABC transporter ATP-binding protein [Plastoroseomonas hellenica]